MSAAASSLLAVDKGEALPAAIPDPTIGGDARRAPPIKVIYIAGYGRSGTTLLDIALGGHAAIMGAGEVTTLARHVWENNEYCACGVPVRECPMWSTIVDEWCADEPPDMLAKYRAAQEKSESIVGRGRSRARVGQQDHGRRTIKLLERMAASSGRPVIVDSSKLPGRAFALSTLPGIELYVVHLVRDGRGVVWSLMNGHERQVEKGLQRELRPKPLLHTALRWMIVNLATETLCRRLGKTRSIRIRYEDFVRDPHATLDRIFRLVGVATVPAQLGAEQRPMTPQHQVAGSRHRMEKTIIVRKDESWMRKMPKRTQIAVAALCAPLMLRYGYSLRPADQPGRSQ